MSVRKLIRTGIYIECIHAHMYIYIYMIYYFKLMTFVDEDVNQFGKIAVGFYITPQSYKYYQEKCSYT